MFASTRRALSDFRGALGSFMKYEVVTRLLMAAVVLPLFSLATSLLVGSRGEGAVTNATLLPFLLSWQGIVFVALLVALITWGIVAELGGSITISARHRFGQPEASYRAVLGHSLRRTPNLLGAGGLLLIVYLVVVLPLTGAAPTLSFLKGVAVPQFVLAVIESNPALFATYLGLLLVLAAASLLLSYTFPLIIIGNLKATPAVRHSARLVLRRPKVFWRSFIAPVLLAGVALALFVTAWAVLILWLLELARSQGGVVQPVLAFLLLLQQVGVLLGLLVIVPFHAQRLTTAFYESLDADPQLAGLRDAYPEIPGKRRRSLLDRLVAKPGRLAVGTVVMLLALAFPLGYAANDLASERAKVTLVGHRVAGVAAPENSIAGLAVAVAHRAEMVEIDVQRTRDGAYILNHDDTFARVAGMNRRSSDLTLAEVKALTLRGTSEKVPTLEEFLVAARGKVQVMIELKGSTADTRMADDVLAQVDRLQMTDAVVLMSLDYRLVASIEKRRPDVVTAFAYFMSIGDVSTLAADIIMLEEGEANAERIAIVQMAGKKAFVWTVNNADLMASLITRGADGLVTDQVAEARDVIDRHSVPSSADLFRELFWGQ